jgi:hypothetical protein
VLRGLKTIIGVGALSLFLLLLHWQPTHVTATVVASSCSKCQPGQTSNPVPPSLLPPHALSKTTVTSSLDIGTLQIVLLLLGVACLLSAAGGEMLWRELLPLSKR